jgi:tubulin--tyrosine ligase-like protein 12
LFLPLLPNNKYFFFKQIFDAGYHFQIRQRVDENDEVLGYKAICINEKGLLKDDPASVFLVDHAWTYRVNNARNCLKENEALLERLCNMMAIQLLDKDQKVNAVFEKMWKYNQTYKLATNDLVGFFQ